MSAAEEKTGMDQTLSMADSRYLIYVMLGKIPSIAQADTK
jgi:hypothetical protein